LLWFGCGLPIVDEPYTYTDDFSEVQRASYSDVVRFIIKDCDAALACNELPWRITTSSDAIRVTKALAWGIKSRMTMFAASPLYATDDSNAITWEEAYQYSKDALAALTANGYELYTTPQSTSVWSASAANSYFPNDYAALYNEYFCNSGAYAEAPADKETIFQLVDGQGNISNVDGIGCINGYKTGTCPTQELVDAYETIDGQPILNLANPYSDEKHLKPNYNSANTLYDPQNPYENRDPRFYASIYYNGSKRYCNWACTELPTCFENYPASSGRRTRIVATWSAYVDDSGNTIESYEPLSGRSLSGRTYTRTGYFERKFLHPQSGVGNAQNAGRHKDYRLAEIYLNLAETAMEAGHTAEAMTAMNVVRARVGMPAVTGLSGDNLRQRIHNERRIEFALEGHRFFDVRRWHKPTDDLSATDHWVTGAYITRLKDGSYKYERSVVKERQCYTNKWLKTAIPLTEVSNIYAATGEDWQNPGW